jgi:Tfp pilus assembly protein PilF
MRLRPNFTDAHLNMARLYNELGETSEAELQFRAAAAMAPLNIQARNELGKQYLRVGRISEAEPEFEASVASIPNTEALDSLADIAIRQGRRNAAEEDYRQAIALDEFDAHGHFGLAAILDAQGKTAEATNQYRAGLEIDPRNQEAQSALERLTSNLSHANPSK